ncbi:hypothetical protein ACPCSC_00635 [Streptomyces lavendulocolor]|uniref:hypothetical protein n=1 Tax=Streptomyces lavendulocolor TaxID=67316 RepID=UPI003C2D4005
MTPQQQDPRHGHTDPYGANAPGTATGTPYRVAPLNEAAARPGTSAEGTATPPGHAPGVPQAPGAPAAPGRPGPAPTGTPAPTGAPATGTPAPTAAPEAPATAGAGTTPAATGTGDPTGTRTGDRIGDGGPDGPPAGARGRTPGTGDVAGVSAPLVPDGTREELARRMQQALSGFVDSPHRSVKEAADVLDAAADELTAALADHRRALRADWDGRDGHDDDQEPATERLRVTLQAYRAMAERLLRV